MATVTTRYQFSARELLSLTGWNQKVVDDYVRSQEESNISDEQLGQIESDIDQLQQSVIAINLEIDTINFEIDGLQSDVATLQSQVSDLETQDDYEPILVARNALDVANSLALEVADLNEIDSTPENAVLIAQLSKRVEDLEDLVNSLI